MTIRQFKLMKRIEKLGGFISWSIVPNFNQLILGSMYRFHDWLKIDSRGIHITENGRQAMYEIDVWSYERANDKSPLAKCLQNRNSGQAQFKVVKRRSNAA